MRKNQVLGDQSGFTLVELLMGAGLSALVLSLAATFLFGALFLERWINKNSALTQLKNEALSIVWQDNAWKKTIAQPAFNCLKNASISPCPPVDSRFNILDKDGQVIISGTDANKGFNNSGIICNTFPSAECNQQWRLSWTAFCETAACNPKQIQINGALILANPNSERGPTSNQEDYTFTLLKNASFDPTVLVFATASADLPGGIPETFVVPLGITSIEARVWGGGGGGGASEGPEGGDGGGGGYVRATLAVVPGETLLMRVAQGGRGGLFDGARGGGGGGGGFSRIERGASSLLIAGGGGGGGSSRAGVFGSRGLAGSGDNGEGGAPGSLSGLGGTGVAGGRGGTLCSGGGGGDAQTHGHDGFAFQGGTGGFNKREPGFQIAGVEVSYAHPCSGMNGFYNGPGGNGALGGIPGGGDGGTPLGQRGGGGGGGGFFGGGGGAGGLDNPAASGGGGGGGSGFTSGSNIFKDNGGHGSVGAESGDVYYANPLPKDPTGAGNGGLKATSPGPGSTGRPGRIVIIYY